MTHDWFKPDFLDYECCRKCGIVKRADGKNKECRGIVRVEMRSQLDQVSAKEND